MRISRTRLDDRSADALLSGRAVAGQPELAAFVARARALPLETPTPSAGLAAMLEGGVPPEVLDRTPVVLAAPARRAVPWRAALVAATAGLVGVLGAGAANALPAPAQRAVADVVGWVTPFHLPEPATQSPAVVPSSTPSSEPRTEPSSSSRPDPAASRGPEPSESPDGRDGERGGTDVRESPSGDGDATSPSGDTESTQSPQPEPSASESPSSDGGSSPDSSSVDGSSSSTSGLSSPTDGSSSGSVSTGSVSTGSVSTSSVSTDTTEG